MIQTRPYEFMVSYTPQRQWIEKGGLKLWLAFFFIELGAGMFFVASLFDNLAAMSVGWLLCAVLGGGFHLLYLGKPLRFWRMMLSSGWKTSWISRGLIFVTLFLALGLAHIVLFQGPTRLTALLILDRTGRSHGAPLARNVWGLSSLEPDYARRYLLWGNVWRIDDFDSCQHPR